MPLGVLQTYDNAERELLRQCLVTARHVYAVGSQEFSVLSRAMADACEYDPVLSAEEYSKSELRELYVLLARASCSYEIDSEEFHVLTKAMADFREQM
jgi:hypothetical protein